MAHENTKALIVAAATGLGVDPLLALSVARAESSFNQSARSPVGAMGVFQLMPKTAASLGVDPAIESQNIIGGVSYLKSLLTKYNGDVPLALAAYNAGPGNVAKYKGVPPFAETRQYIARIDGYRSELLAAGGVGPVAPVVQVADNSEPVNPFKPFDIGGGKLPFLEIMLGVGLAALAYWVPV